MTEAQKYQGALYKEKPSKKQSKAKNNNSNNNAAGNSTKSNSNTNGKPRPPYVGDAPDADGTSSNNPPPPAPSPPPATAAAPSSTTVAPTENNAVNVFDYLVTSETPNASKVSLGGTKSQMRMVDHAPSVFEPSKALTRVDTDVDDEEKEYDIAYEENGFSYGAEPIKPSLYPNQNSNISMEFMTPAPKKSKDRNRGNKDRQASPDNSQANGTTDKKRKRGHAEDLDINAANSQYDEDTPMLDAPSSVLNNAGTPVLNHSGLTGGLNKMLRSDGSHSSEYEDYDDEHDNGRDPDPTSPLKRSRRGEKQTNGENGLGISVKGRTARIMSMFGGSAVSGSSAGGNEPPSQALVRTRCRSSSDVDENPTPLVQIRRSKKTHRVVHPRSPESRKSKRKSSNETHYELSRPSRRQKAIEHHRDSDRSRLRSPRRGDDERRLIVYRHSKASGDELQREKARHFLSLVTKGPESERGCSVHKALKRFHRDLPSLSGSEEREGERHRRKSRTDKERRSEEEKELWRTLRLKKNDRGEVVVFF